MTSAATSAATSAGMSLIAPDIQVNGEALPAAYRASLIELKIRRELRLPARAVLSFVDDGFALSAGDAFTLGSKVTISVALGQLLFSGEVTGVSLQLERGSPEVSVVVDDLAYQLGMGTKVRTFLQQRYSDIIRTMALDAGLSAQIQTSDSTQHDYVLQADSDLGFLTEIVDRSGGSWYVKDDKLFVFDQVGTGPTLTFGESCWSFSVNASGLHPRKTTSTGWASSTKQEMVGLAAAVPPPAAALVQDHVVGTKLKGSSSETRTAVDNPFSMAEAMTLADGRRRADAGGSVSARGTCLVNAELELGSTVTVLNAGPASGTYRVTEIQHVYTTRGFETRFSCAGGPPTGLVDTLAAPTVSSFRHTGLMIGIVTDNKPVGKAGTGTIKVKFPTVASDVESHWARVASVGAGSSRGLTFMPEINDEVLVGFEGGDLRRPVILGGLYNGKDAATDWGQQTNASQVDRRRITSRLGHYLEFGDAPAPESQHVEAVLSGGKHRLRLGKNGITGEVPAGQPITLKSGEASISIDAAGNIDIKGQKVSIDAKQDVSIAGLNITAKAKVNLDLAAQVAAVLKAQAKVELAASGQTLISGAMVKVN